MKDKIQERIKEHLFMFRFGLIMITLTFIFGFLSIALREWNFFFICLLGMNGIGILTAITYMLILKEKINKLLEEKNVRRTKENNLAG